MPSRVELARPAPPAILLVDPEGPRNVGAVARAMANFGLADLRLVGADTLSRHRTDDEAIATAMGGRAVLRASRIYPSVLAAREGLDALAGATRLPGRRRAPILHPWELAAAISSGRRRLGILLGNEVTGLERQDLRQCEFLVRIPSVEPAGSLNLAQAAMILVYEWRRLEATSGPTLAASPGKREDLLAHAERTLTAAGFLSRGDPLRAMPKLRRLLGRANATDRELGLLHAILQHWDRTAGSAPRSAGRA